jgi:hypothetical protein
MAGLHDDRKGEIDAGWRARGVSGLGALFPVAGLKITVGCPPFSFGIFERESSLSARSSQSLRVTHCSHLIFQMVCGTMFT